MSKNQTENQASTNRQQGSGKQEEMKYNSQDQLPPPFYRRVYVRLRQRRRRVYACPLRSWGIMSERLTRLMMSMVMLVPRAL